MLMSWGGSEGGVPRPWPAAPRRKAEAIAEALSRGGFQFGFLHVKAVDDTGHDFLVQQKVGGQERLRLNLLGAGRQLG